MKTISLPAGYKLIKAAQTHQAAAQHVIFEVLKEYGFQPDVDGADDDMVDLMATYRHGYFGLIKDDSSNFVGAFGLHPLREKTCKIRRMYLLPTARGKSLGQWMLRFMIDKATELGYDRIELETATRLKNAVALYKGFGFQQLISENATPECDLVFYKKLS